MSDKPGLKYLKRRILKGHEVLCTTEGGGCTTLALCNYDDVESSFSNAHLQSAKKELNKTTEELFYKICWDEQKDFSIVPWWGDEPISDEAKAKILQEFEKAALVAQSVERLKKNLPDWKDDPVFEAEYNVAQAQNNLIGAADELTKLKIEYANAVLKLREVEKDEA